MDYNWRTTFLYGNAIERAILLLKLILIKAIDRNEKEICSIFKKDKLKSRETQFQYSKTLEYMISQKGEDFVIGYFNQITWRNSLIADLVSFAIKNKDYEKFVSYAALEADNKQLHDWFDKYNLMFLEEILRCRKLRKVFFSSGINSIECESSTYMTLHACLRNVFENFSKQLTLYVPLLIESGRERVIERYGAICGVPNFHLALNDSSFEIEQVEPTEENINLATEYLKSILKGMDEGSLLDKEMLMDAVKDAERDLVYYFELKDKNCCVFTAEEKELLLRASKMPMLSFLYQKVFLEGIRGDDMIHFFVSRKDKQDAHSYISGKIVEQEALTHEEAWKIEKDFTYGQENDTLRLPQDFDTYPSVHDLHYEKISQHHYVPEYKKYQKTGVSIDYTNIKAHQIEQLFNQLVEWGYIYNNEDQLFNLAFRLTGKWIDHMTNRIIWRCVDDYSLPMFIHNFFVKGKKTPYTLSQKFFVYFNGTKSQKVFEKGTKNLTAYVESKVEENQKFAKLNAEIFGPK